MWHLCYENIKLAESLADGIALLLPLPLQGS
jgi:hypothetical protein